MKKFLCVILPLVMLLSFAACGESKKSIYKKAMDLYDQGMYESAMQTLEIVEGYKPADEKMDMVKAAYVNSALNDTDSIIRITNFLKEQDDAFIAYVKDDVQKYLVGLQLEYSSRLGDYPEIYLEARELADVIGLGNDPTTYVIKLITDNFAKLTKWCQVKNFLKDYNNEVIGILYEINDSANSGAVAEFVEEANKLLAIENSIIPVTKQNEATELFSDVLKRMAASLKESASYSDYDSQNAAYKKYFAASNEYNDAIRAYNNEYVHVMSEIQINAQLLKDF